MDQTGIQSSGRLQSRDETRCANKSLQDMSTQSGVEFEKALRTRRHLNQVFMDGLPATPLPGKGELRQKGKHMQRPRCMTRCCCCWVAKSSPTPCNCMDCSLPGSSVHWISQAKILEWVAISFSRGSSRPMDLTRVSCIGRWILYHWAIREAPGDSDI